MSLATILAGLITLMQNAPGLGHLYPYERVLIPPEDVQAVFGIEDPTCVRGWSVRSWQWFRTGVNEERLDLSGEHIRVTHHLNLRGYWEHNDVWQSEVDFRTTIDAIRALLRDPLVLQPDATLTLLPQVARGDEGLVVIGENYTCHHAIITLDAQELLDSNEQDDWILLLPSNVRDVVGPFDFA